MARTKREFEEQVRMLQALDSLGFTDSECQTLRRASMTLRRWHELECGTGDDRISRSIERDETTGKTYMRVQYHATAYVDRKYPTPDRETGARARIIYVVNARNARESYRGISEKPDSQTTADYIGSRNVSAYIQTDPRGAALYILRPGDVPQGGSPSAYYTNGICVY